MSQSPSHHSNPFLHKSPLSLLIFSTSSSGNLRGFVSPPFHRKFITTKLLNWPIRESLYPQKLILALLGDRESLSLRNLVPTYP